MKQNNIKNIYRGDIIWVAGKESISGTCDSISEGCLWKAWKNNGFHGRAACNNR